MRADRAIQMVIKGKERSLPWILPILCRVSGYNTKYHNLENYPHYHVVFDGTFSTVGHMRNGTAPLNWENLVEYHSDLTTQKNFTLSKKCHINESSIMTLPRDAWQEDSQEPIPQDLPPGSDPQAAPIGI